jgi:hypothetical protein
MTAEVSAKTYEADKILRSLLWIALAAAAAYFGGGFV